MITNKVKKTTNEKLKPQLEKILILIYQYRFINSQQIQTLLNHKYKTRINLWLKYLTQEKYLIREYVKKFPEEPAVYSLGLKGKRYLEQNIGTNPVRPRLLERVYRERKYSKKFKMHCMSLADVYSSLRVFATQNNLELDFYTKTQITGMEYLIEKEPDAYFLLNDKKGLSRTCLLEVFDRFSEWKDIERRIMEYIKYYEGNVWQSYANKPFPEIILISPDDNTTKHLQKFIKSKLTQEYEDLLFHLSSWDEIKSQGIKREVLHKVEIK